MKKEKVINLEKYKDKLIAVRVPLDIYRILKLKNYNVSAVVRDHLIKFVKELK